MVRKTLIIVSIWLPVMFLLFFYEAPARIRFTFPFPPRIKSPASFVVVAVVDRRPPDERGGRRGMPSASIRDDHFAGGFAAAFKDGLQRSLARTYAPPAGTRTIAVRATVRHFYGEYRRPPYTALWEQMTVALLHLPRLITDVIPYNSFSGRVAFDLEFTGRDGVTVSRRLDVRVREKISTWQRGPRGATDLLCAAAAPEIAAMIDELVNCR